MSKVDFFEKSYTFKKVVNLKSHTSWVFLKGEFFKKVKQSLFVQYVCVLCIILVGFFGLKLIVHLISVCLDDKYRKNRN